MNPFELNDILVESGDWLTKMDAVRVELRKRLQEFEVAAKRSGKSREWELHEHYQRQASATYDLAGVVRDTIERLERLKVESARWMEETK